MFESVQPNGRSRTTERLMALALSVSLHTIMIAALVLLPLMLLRVLPASELITFLIVPPAVPPPLYPPPPGPRDAGGRERSVAYHEEYWRDNLAPEQVPRGLPPPGDEPPIVGAAPGVYGSGFILPGLTGTSGLGFTAGLIDATPPAIVPPPPRPPRPSVVRVGGTVQESKLIRKVLPIYPEITIRARISGEVVLEVTIDEEGNVGGIRVLSGHMLLRDAAVQAVRQWKYSPTLLNGEPVTVVSVVRLLFVLK